MRISLIFLITCLEALNSSQPALLSLWRTWAPAAEETGLWPPVVLILSALAVALSWVQAGKLVSDLSSHSSLPTVATG